VCAIAGTSIEVWVEAVVRAWAEGWAVAIQCEEKCIVEVEAVVESVGKILVDAATDAYAFLCDGAFLVTVHIVMLLMKSCHGVILLQPYAWQFVLVESSPCVLADP
jgi:hypothetical protein